MAEFDIDEMLRLYDEGLLKDRLDCKNYVAQFFFPLTNGTYALIEGGELTIVQRDVMNTVWLPRFPKDIKTWFNTKTKPKKLICDIYKPKIGNTYINTAKHLKHKYQSYKTFSKKTKESVVLMLLYIKEVLANNNEKVYDYLLKWLSNMIKGIKNKSCIYIKSSQGTGKSTLPEFIRDFVIGKEITCKGKSDHLKGQHNMQLLGRIFVYFEELQLFSDREWYAIDAELKDMITDTFGSYTDKYEKRFEAENINNYMITTNSSLKGVNGRRYFVLDMNPKYLDDFTYYGKLRKECFNDEVGKAFYCYLHEINTDEFNSLDMPITKNKAEMISDLLTPVEKFLKFGFVLSKASIDMKLGDLLDMFNNFNLKADDISPQKFSTMMRELGFDYKRFTDCNRYIISYEQLKAIADKGKWVSDIDSDFVDEYLNDATDYGIKKADLSVKVSLDEQIEHYQNLLNNLKQQKMCELEKQFKQYIDEKPTKVQKVKKTVSFVNVLNE